MDILYFFLYPLAQEALSWAEMSAVTLQAK